MDNLLGWFGTKTTVLAATEYDDHGAAGRHGDPEEPGEFLVLIFSHRQLARQR